MRINISNEFLDIMLLRDIRQHNPLCYPNTYLGLSCAKETFNEETKAIIKKFVRIDSYLVSTNQKKMPLISSVSKAFLKLDPLVLKKMDHTISEKLLQRMESL